MKRSHAVHIMSCRGFVQLNKKARPDIGAAGHAPVSSHKHGFRQQIVGSNQQGEFRQCPDSLSHRVKIAHVQAAIFEPDDVGLGRKL